MNRMTDDESDDGRNAVKSHLKRKLNAPTFDTLQALASDCNRVSCHRNSHGIAVACVIFFYLFSFIQFIKHCAFFSSSLLFFFSLISCSAFSVSC